MKIIQIAVTSGGESNAVDSLYALTDTGELWFQPKANETDNPPQWRRIKLPVAAENTLKTGGAA